MAKLFYLTAGNSLLLPRNYDSKTGKVDSQRCMPPFIFNPEDLRNKKAPQGATDGWIEQMLDRGVIAEVKDEPTIAETQQMASAGITPRMAKAALSGQQISGEGQSNSGGSEPDPNAQKGEVNDVRVFSDEMLAGMDEDTLRSEIHRVRPEMSAEALSQISKDQLVEVAATLVAPENVVAKLHGQ